MGLRVEEREEGCCLLVEGDVTIYSVTQLREELLRVLEEHHEIEVDLSAVQEIDSAGLQLMLAAKRCEGKTVRFINHSAAVLQLIELANLGGRLGDPLLLPAADAAAPARH